jgi:hypothetical protein
MALVRNASILFACTMIGNASNYLFQFVMGRSLTLEDFGTMNALLSVMTSITLPTTAIMFVVAKYASTYRALGEDPGISSLYVRSMVRITAVAVLLTSVFILSSGAIKGYLNVPALSPVLILAVGIFSAFVLTVNFGMLQGLQRFYLLGIGIGVSGLLRLLLGMIFIYAGLRLNGALLATTLPALIVLTLTVVPLSKYFKGASPEFRHKKILRYSVPVLIASSIFAFLTNVDIMMVKHYLAPDDAGIYASISVLGKTMFYLPSSFALALFPMVSVSDAVNGDSFKILDKALLLTLLISVAALLLFAAAPELILTAPVFMAQDKNRKMLSELKGVATGLVLHNTDAVDLYVNLMQDDLLLFQPRPTEPALWDLAIRSFGIQQPFPQHDHSIGNSLYGELTMADYALTSSSRGAALRKDFPIHKPGRFRVMLRSYGGPGYADVSFTLDGRRRAVVNQSKGAGFRWHKLWEGTLAQGVHSIEVAPAGDERVYIDSVLVADPVLMDMGISSSGAFSNLPAVYIQNFRRFILDGSRAETSLHIGSSGPYTPSIRLARFADLSAEKNDKEVTLLIDGTPVGTVPYEEISETLEEFVLPDENFQAAPIPLPSPG